MRRPLGILVQALRHDIRQRGAYVFSAACSFAHSPDDLISRSAGGEISRSSGPQDIDSTAIFRMMTEDQDCQAGMRPSDVSQDMKPVFRSCQGQIDDENIPSCLGAQPDNLSAIFKFSRKVKIRRGGEN